MSNLNEITPYNQSEETQINHVSNLNYTNQDFWSMKSRLVQFINERFGENGTVLPNTFYDFVESSIAIMLIENWAFLADTLSFKMDQIVNELFIDTVTEVENAFRLCKLVGFQPQPPIASRSMWVGTISNNLSVDLEIPTPLAINVVSNNKPITIELFAADANNIPIFNQNIVIPAGAISNQTIVGLEGFTRNDIIKGTGETNQTIKLAYGPVIYNSIRVDVDGVTWNQVDSFTDSQPRREYRIEFDSSYSGYVVFGNNRAGMIPAAGSKVVITYRQGGGTIGNIVTGFVQTQTQVSVPGFGFSVPVSLRNYTKGQYGYDGDGIEEIRRKLPTFLRTQDRAVSANDYKTLADQFATAYHGQIGKSIATLRNHGCAGNIIDLFVLAKNGDNDLEQASSELKVDLNETLNAKKMMTDYICIKDGNVISVDVNLDITMDKFYRKFELETKKNITQRINNYFSLNNWEYGQSLKDTDIVKLLSDLKEIKELEIALVTNNPNNSGTTVATKYYEIIRTDNVTISFMYV